MRIAIPVALVLALALTLWLGHPFQSAEVGDPGTTPQNDPAAEHELRRLREELTSLRETVEQLRRSAASTGGRRSPEKTPSLWRAWAERLGAVEDFLHSEGFMGEDASEPTPILTPRVLTDAGAFEELCGGAILAVTFDDVDTAGNEAVSFEEDRYLASHHLVIRGRDGQYAGPFSDRYYDPFSAPNVYAPGPFDADGSPGGTRTEITFWKEGRPAAVAGFGAFFIDADYPAMGASRLAVFGEHNQKLGKIAGFRGADRSQLFRGIVVLDENGTPVPAIYRVELVNGGVWAGRHEGEGVVLDDCIYPSPIAAPAGSRLARRSYEKRTSRHGVEQPIWNAPEIEEAPPAPEHLTNDLQLDPPRRFGLLPIEDSGVRVQE